MVAVDSRHQVKLHLNQTAAVERVQGGTRVTDQHSVVSEKNISNSITWLIPGGHRWVNNYVIVGWVQHVCSRDWVVWWRSWKFWLWSHCVVTETDDSQLWLQQQQPRTISSSPLCCTVLQCTVQYHTQPGSTVLCTSSSTSSPALLETLLALIHPLLSPSLVGSLIQTLIIKYFYIKWHSTFFDVTICTLSILINMCLEKL